MIPAIKITLDSVLLNYFPSLSFTDIYLPSAALVVKLCRVAGITFLAYEIKENPPLKNCNIYLCAGDFLKLAVREVAAVWP